MSPASALTVMGEVADVLDHRSTTGRPSVTTAVSDRVALGIADMFRSTTPSGQVLERFARTGTADSAALIEACRVEQGYASAEGHAALYCLIGWVHKQRHRAATTP
ncbi:hypothetical protein [Trujillonella endophytica]|uniref:hypothetical protein n=1 Tax=Trujillonella endophytica TaxID=673521 RepID=UPI001FCCCB69|nr:hypothetical protein [Trujillella endophytica]